MLSIAKDDLNANFVRLAHYPHAESMTRAADEMGLLVWSEIPVYWDIDFANAEQDPDHGELAAIATRIGEALRTAGHDAAVTA